MTARPSSAARAPTPARTRPASCYLVEADRRRAAAPGGSCSTSAAARSARCSGTPTRSAIDAVFLSHLHADHCLDLCGYYVLRKYHPDRRAAADPGLGPGRHRRAGWPGPTTSARGPG